MTMDNGRFIVFQTSIIILMNSKNTPLFIIPTHYSQNLNFIWDVYRRSQFLTLPNGIFKQTTTELRQSINGNICLTYQNDLFVG